MKMLPLLTAATLLLGITVANAAEPVALTNTQLDTVTAGASMSTFAFSQAATGTNATVTGTLTQSTTATSAILIGTFITSSS
jgi:hypothetical protein